MKNSKFGIFKKEIKMLNLFLEIVTENSEQNIIPTFSYVYVIWRENENMGSKHALVFIFYEQIVYLALNKFY